MLYYERYLESASYIMARIREPMPDTAIVLGSGFGSIVEKMDDKKVIPYNEVPHFPICTTNDNVGELVYGHLNYAPVLVMNGKPHYYEGYDMEELTFPIRVFSRLGVKNLILVGVVAGINFNYVPGDLMLVSDHIDLSGISPLRGKNYNQFGPRFVDTSNIYDKELMKLVYSCARELALPINEGVFAYRHGPSYDTPAEVKMLRTLGADVVGMSTVPEAIIAKHCGLRTIAISGISDMAAGILTRPLSGEEVFENTNKMCEQLYMLIQKLTASLYINHGDTH